MGSKLLFVWCRRSGCTPSPASFRILLVAVARWLMTHDARQPLLHIDSYVGHTHHSLPHICCCVDHTHHLPPPPFPDEGTSTACARAIAPRPRCPEMFSSPPAARIHWRASCVSWNAWRATTSWCATLPCHNCTTQPELMSCPVLPCPALHVPACTSNLKVPSFNNSLHA